MLTEVLSCTAIASPDTVAATVEAFIQRTRPDELITTSHQP